MGAALGRLHGPRAQPLEADRVRPGGVSVLWAGGLGGTDQRAPKCCHDRRRRLLFGERLNCSSWTAPSGPRQGSGNSAAHSAFSSAALGAPGAGAAAGELWGPGPGSPGRSGEVPAEGAFGDG